MSASAGKGGGSGFSRGQVRAWALALDMVYSVVAGGAVGYVLDRWAFGTTPWLTLSGALLGLVGGMARFIREANRLNRETARRQRDRSSDTHAD